VNSTLCYKIGDCFWVKAALWKKDYKPWPIPGNILLQYFRGEIINIDTTTYTKPWYTVKYDADDGTNFYDVNFLKKECIWTEPLEGVINKQMWTEGLKSIKKIRAR